MARMTAGDELKLTLNPVGERAHGKPWEGLGQVLRIADSEVALMMLGGNVPLDVTDGYQVMRPTIVSYTSSPRVCNHRGCCGRGPLPNRRVLRFPWTRSLTPRSNLGWGGECSH